MHKNHLVLLFKNKAILLFGWQKTVGGFYEIFAYFYQNGFWWFKI
ncbi:hypothetical protein MHD_06730 [Mannheimia granulomatis]|uniref:Uncharacterized protein n=1 Tax=Mannheimia granulomatis TaxID=85402 RepID=A0A011P939_9PAST|nr:hypothetical protein AK33_03460 [Mannheimia granulomatis]RGE48170.1 hypothetical protein MHD_06730 [Mannheimia granulomatis]